MNRTLLICAVSFLSVLFSCAGLHQTIDKSRGDPYSTIRPYLDAQNDFDPIHRYLSKKFHDYPDFLLYLAGLLIIWLLYRLNRARLLNSIEEPEVQILHATPRTIPQPSRKIYLDPVDQAILAHLVETAGDLKYRIEKKQNSNVIPIRPDPEPPDPQTPIYY